MSESQYVPFSKKYLIENEDHGKILDYVERELWWDNILYHNPDDKKQTKDIFWTRDDKKYEICIGPENVTMYVDNSLKLMLDKHLFFSRHQHIISYYR